MLAPRLSEVTELLSQCDSATNLATITLKGLRDTPTKLRPRNNIFICIGPVKTHTKYGYSFFYSDIDKVDHAWKFSFKNVDEAKIAISVYKRRAFGKDKFVGKTETLIKDFLSGVNKEKQIFDTTGNPAGWVNLQVVY